MAKCYVCGTKFSGLQARKYCGQTFCGDCTKNLGITEYLDTYEVSRGGPTDIRIKDADEFIQTASRRRAAAEQRAPLFSPNREMLFNDYLNEIFVMSNTTYRFLIDDVNRLINVTQNSTSGSQRFEWTYFIPYEFYVRHEQAVENGMVSTLHFYYLMGGEREKRLSFCNVTDEQKEFFAQLERLKTLA